MRTGIAPSAWVVLHVAALQPSGACSTCGKDVRNNDMSCNACVSTEIRWLRCV